VPEVLEAPRPVAVLWSGRERLAAVADRRLKGTDHRRGQFRRGARRRGGHEDEPGPAVSGLRVMYRSQSAGSWVQPLTATGRRVHPLPGRASSLDVVLKAAEVRIIEPSVSLSGIPNCRGHQRTVLYLRCRQVGRRFLEASAVKVLSR
jgi:hypothetical protein